MIRKKTLDYSTSKISERKIDENGFWSIEKNPIARAGVMTYSLDELPYFEGFEAIEEGTLLKVLKAPEGFTPEYLESLKGKPILVEHAWLSDENKDLSETYTAGNIGDNVFFEDGIVYANLYINSLKAQKLISDGVRELSVGSLTTVTPKKGVFEGEDYDYVMHHNTANHVSLVENGRCGSKIRILDKQEGVMAKKEKVLDKILNMLRVQTYDESSKSEDETELELIESKLDGFEEKDEIIEIIKTLIKKTKHVVEDADQEEKTASSDEESDEKDCKASDNEKSDEPFSEAQMRAIEMIIEKVLNSTKDEVEKKVMDSMQNAVVEGNRLRTALVPFLGAIPQEYVTTQKIVEYASKKLEITPTLDAIQGYIQGKGSSFSQPISNKKLSSFEEKIIQKRRS